MKIMRLLRKPLAILLVVPLTLGMVACQPNNAPSNSVTESVTSQPDNNETADAVDSIYNIIDNSRDIKAVWIDDNSVAICDLVQEKTVVTIVDVSGQILFEYTWDTKDNFALRVFYSDGIVTAINGPHILKVDVSDYSHTESIIDNYTDYTNISPSGWVASCETYGVPFRLISPGETNGEVVKSDCSCQTAGLSYIKRSFYVISHR